ncbi:MAG: M14 family metallopeptidase [Bacillota bacterium]
MNLCFDHYHTNAEVRAFLEECLREYPRLCRLECIGRSYQDREILMLEITNRETGPGSDKPGVYADGNTHAGEVTGCEVILYSIKQLLEGYGKDPKITKLIDTRTFYFVPRITVDGSEYYLSTPHMLRSSLHPWPGETDDKPGLYPDDIDGNGKILSMRVKNPDGGWKVSSKDPRIMVRRRPDEMGEVGDIFYDVFTEGFIRDYDPDVTVKRAPGMYGLDFNRQYPANWAIHTRQPGSGDYPFSEPEMKAIGDFYLSHPNIVTSMSYHTSGGLILRPFCDKKDSAFDRRDLEIYKAVGEVGNEITGYPLVSVFEEFTRDQERPPVGSVLEWAYESLGILSLETELWDMAGQAGIQRRSPQAARNLTEKEREEEAVEILRWNDEKMGGVLFHDWKPFQHPQLGEVEIGGWEPKFGRQNPPVALLEEECRKNAQFNLARAAVTPRLVIEKVTATGLGGGIYNVEAVIRNEGYLPTHGTFRALAMRQTKPVKVTLDGLDAGSRPVDGEIQREIGHLGGRAGGGDAKTKVQWVIRGSKGQNLTVTAYTPRAGKARGTVVLE